MPDVFLVSIKGEYLGGLAAAFALREWEDDASSPVVRDLLTYPEAVYYYL